MTGPAVFSILQYFLAALIVLVACFLHALPGLTRRELFFAVTVAPEHAQSAAARQVVHRYRKMVWLHSLVALSLVFAASALHHLPLLPLAGIFWQIIASYFAFLAARKATLPYAVSLSPRREAQVAPRPVEGLAFRLLQLGPFAILATVALFLRNHWDRIPPRFPIHWSLSGQPNGWATRSIHGVFGLLFVACAVCAALTLLVYAILHWSRQISASGAAAETENRFRLRVMSAVLAAEYLLTLIFSWAALLPLPSSPAVSPTHLLWIMTGELVFVAAIFVLFMRTGQGGSALATSEPASPSGSPSEPVGDRTEDRFWKAGAFYVNRNDPAVIVEKRFGVGYTFNWAQPRAWLLLAAITLAPLVVVLLVTRRH